MFYIRFTRLKTYTTPLGSLCLVFTGCDPQDFGNTLLEWKEKSECIFVSQTSIRCLLAYSFLNESRNFTLTITIPKFLEKVSEDSYRILEPV